MEGKNVVGIVVGGPFGNLRLALEHTAVSIIDSARRANGCSSTGMQESNSSESKSSTHVLNISNTLK